MGGKRGSLLCSCIEQCLEEISLSRTLVSRTIEVPTVLILIKELDRAFTILGYIFPPA